MSDSNPKVVHVEKTERPADDPVTMIIKGGLGVPFTIDTGGTEYAVTLDDGTVGRGASQEEAIKNARDKG